MPIFALHASDATIDCYMDLNQAWEYTLTRRMIILYLFYSIIALTIFLLLVVVITHTFLKPNNDREWALDQKVLPSARFDGNMVTIQNIRNFLYASTTEYKPNYYNAIFNIDEVVSVDYIVEPLAPIAMAHTFVSFGFKDGSYLVISVEIRKQKGERFSPLRGLLNQYELMYVIADERDAIQLRAIHRNDAVYLYPLTISPSHMRALFTQMLTRANTLAEHPEFYNTVTNNCTTNIRDHINAIIENAMPWDSRILLPLHSDEYVYELGLLNSSVPFQELHDKSKVNGRVLLYAGDPEFSKKIRQNTELK